MVHIAVVATNRWEERISSDAMDVTAWNIVQRLARERTGWTAIIKHATRNTLMSNRVNSKADCFLKHCQRMKELQQNWKSLEINIMTIQLKLFLDHSETILKQASSLNIPLCDCVVTFDLRDCPFTIATVRYTIHYDSAELEKAFDGSRSKDNITCIYWSNVYNGELDEDGDIPILEMQRFFPHEWLWKKAKKN